jgi:hypothetical protein
LENPVDPLSDTAAAAEPPTCPEGGSGPDGIPQAGDTLTYDPGCADPFTTWYLVDSTTGTRTEVSAGVAAPYIVADVGIATGFRVEAVGSCPDPSAPSGYGEGIDSCREEVDPSIKTAPYSTGGGQGTFSYVISVGEGPGTVLFSYDGGGAQADTFTLSGAVTYSITTAATGSINLTKTSSSGIVNVTISAPDSGTAWDFTVAATVPA